jgi:hypothetical protein
MSASWRSGLMTAHCDMRPFKVHRCRTGSSLGCVKFRGKYAGMVDRDILWLTIWANDTNTVDLTGLRLPSRQCAQEMPDQIYSIYGCPGCFGLFMTFLSDLGSTPSASNAGMCFTEYNQTYVVFSKRYQRGLKTVRAPQAAPQKLK